MGWKKNRKQGELAFEGGILGLPMINELASAFVDVTGVAGQMGSGVINTLQEPVTGTALEDMQITENVSAEDITKLITEILASGGASALKSAPKAASLVDDIIKQAGNKSITVPVPTGVGSATGGAKVKLKDIASGLAQGTKNVGTKVKEQIAPIRFGGQEGSLARKLLNTGLMPRAGKSGTILPNMPKFNYFTPQSSSTWKNLQGIKDKAWIGTKNLPFRALNTPSAFLNSRYGTAPTSYGLYKGFEGLGQGDPNDATGPLFDFGRGVTGAMYDTYINPLSGSPIQNYVSTPLANFANTLMSIGGNEEAVKAKNEEIARQVTDAYYGTSGSYNAPTQINSETTDSLSQVIDNILKFSEEDVKILEDTKRMNKNIQKQDTTKTSKTFNFNLKDLK